jgi:hypothetical protein
VGVVDDAVQDGVGVGWIVDDVVPAVDRDLAGDDGGPAAIPFFEDLEEIAPGAGVEGLAPPIVEDEQLGTDEGAQEPSVATVAAGERQLAEELGHSLVEDRAVVAAGSVTQCRGQPTLTDAGWAGEDQIVVGVDPRSVDELLQPAAIETALGAIIDILDDGVVA